VQSRIREGEKSLRRRRWRAWKGYHYIFWHLSYTNILKFTNHMKKYY